MKIVMIMNGVGKKRKERLLTQNFEKEDYITIKEIHTLPNTKSNEKGFVCATIIKMLRGIFFSLLHLIQRIGKTHEVVDAMWQSLSLFVPIKMTEVVFNFN
jgi:hypothetical protein